MRKILLKGLFLTTVFIVSGYFTSKAYSVLTHEAIIDAVWEKSLVPAIKDRYPSATDSQLKVAHAYAYGGAVAPDMGYFPFGSKLFTNLIHYVRSGDFVKALLEESTNVNEYAFALGCLAHYNADNYGHPLGTNRSAPLLFPKMRKKYGDTVTYGEDPMSHVRTEFSFDVLQTARGNYASMAYHDFIGFKVADTVLRRAFLKTYGLDINDIFSNFQRSVNTFRWCVKELFPVLTRAAWASKKGQLRKSPNRITRRSYVYKLRRKAFEHEYGKDRDKPGFLTSSLAMVIRILPKVGPLKKLKIIVPGPEAEKLFIQSFDTTVVHFIASVARVRNTAIILPNRDFDTGKETTAGEYGLADESYSDLLMKLKKNNFAGVTAQLRQNILRFYASANKHSKSNVSEEESAALAELKSGL